MDYWYDADYDRAWDEMKWLCTTRRCAWCDDVFFPEQPTQRLCEGCEWLSKHDPDEYEPCDDD